jgi:hypothetical protein
MMSPDESICLGACYIYPSEKSGFDAKAFWWVRTSALADGFDERLGAAFRSWLRDCWPFKRCLPWSRYLVGRVAFRNLISRDAQTTGQCQQRMTPSIIDRRGRSDEECRGQ